MKSVIGSPTKSVDLTTVTVVSRRRQTGYIRKHVTYNCTFKVDNNEGLCLRDSLLFTNEEKWRS